MKLLEIKNLHTYFDTDDGIVKAVDGVDVQVEKGEVVAVVGGSGSGKTILALSILGLVPEPGMIIHGSILFDGKDLVRLSKNELRKVRGAGISMIFQEPMTSLNPVFTIGNQIEEAITVHNRAMPGEDVEKRAMELLNLVGIPEPESRLKNYPHEMSGGMRQRVMIAMALACKPKLLIADEPTTALDVTIQAQILELLVELKDRLDMSIVFITHDLGIVAQLAGRVYVMHHGKVVESGRTTDIFKNPKDDYTKKLLAAVPKL